MQEEKLKIGDLVETCQMLPGFLTEINEEDNSCSVYIPGKHRHWAGGSHSINNCGVHKITGEYAMKLFAIGDDRLKELWEETDFEEMTWEKAVDEEYEKLKHGKVHKPMTLDEQLEFAIKVSGYADCPKYIVSCLEKILAKYKEEN